MRYQEKNSLNLYQYFSSAYDNYYLHAIDWVSQNSKYNSDKYLSISKEVHEETNQFKSNNTSTNKHHFLRNFGKFQSTSRWYNCLFVDFNTCCGREILYYLIYIEQAGSYEDI